uniref:G protein-coupled receptor 89A n=1 Tax=Eptatretus burgeri TaxID=7764 RepID=A0A8C4PXY8_EPTBU
TIPDCSFSCFLLFQVLFFGFGWLFFMRKLFKDYEVRQIVMLQLIFSMTFALSCTMFELIIFEILGLLNTSSRYMHWKLNLYVMLLFIVLLVPFYISYFAVSHVPLLSSQRLPAACTVWGSFMLLFWKIGDPFPILSPRHGTKKTRKHTNAGFGVLKLILKVIENLFTFRTANIYVVAKKNKIKTGWGYCNRLSVCLSVCLSVNLLNGCEVSALEELSRQLFVEVVDLHASKERVAYSRTLQGRYFFFHLGKTDPVTRGLEITAGYFGLSLDVKFWSQHVSFILVGIIVITSIRGLLITLTKFFYAISSTKSSNVIVLVLAQIMGMYFVSCVLLLRMSLPLAYRGIITEVLGDLHFSFYHRWFDVIFLLSALSSMGFLYLARKHAP